MRTAHRQYLRLFIPAMLSYTLVLALSVFVLDHWGGRMALATRALLVLLPTLPIALMCYAMQRYVRQCDELERQIELESIAMAALIVGFVYMCLGFLASGEIIHLQAALTALMVFPALCGVYGLCKLWAARRYQ